ncbi:MAG: MraY family glycosyltransferase [Phoenicibacter congonensis]|uniref:MraY family glycosyltransferase n=1 Tax=Phoenicibacter congonensis TaxID=1944646 RepID=A0AA43RIX8_9ACTN|nr:MraY family glycosyltransferase [Phoenicibacter congonensis]
MTIASYIEIFVLFAIALITTIALTPFAKKIAVAFDAIDYPDARRVNKEPIPRMGGIAIFGGIVVAFIILEIGVNFFGWFGYRAAMMSKGINIPVVALGVVCMFATGLVDDIVGLKPKVKFLMQIVAATIVCAGGIQFAFIQNPFVPGGLIQFGIFAWPITIFYLVAFANIINLIDGLDGLASGICIITALTIGIYSALANIVEAIVLPFILVGTCLGFLKYNHHPAKIFMGDSGSLTLGLFLGIVSLLAIARTAFVFSLLVPIMAAGVPITDTLVAIIRRKKAHQPVGQADKGHIHHRLLQAGFSQTKTVAIMWIWSAVLSICGLAFAELEGIAKLLSLFIAAIITGYAIYKLRLLEPVLQHYYNPRKRRKKVSDDQKTKHD